MELLELRIWGKQSHHVAIAIRMFCTIAPWFFYHSTISPHASSPANPTSGRAQITRNHLIGHDITQALKFSGSCFAVSENSVMHAKCAMHVKECVGICDSNAMQERRQFLWPKPFLRSWFAKDTGLKNMFSIIIPHIICMSVRPS